MLVAAAEPAVAEIVTDWPNVNVSVVLVATLDAPLIGDNDEIVGAATGVSLVEAPEDQAVPFRVKIVKFASVQLARLVTVTEVPVPL